MRMRFVVEALLVFGTGVVNAQMQQGQMGNGPAGPSYPSNAPAAQDVQAEVEMRGDGRCIDVRPGDMVHYSLTIESVDGARGVYANLLLRPKGAPALRPAGLQVPDYRTLNGGGVGERDASTSNVYRFVFRVPQQIVSGVYRGVALEVTSNDARTQAARDAGEIDVTRHVREQVRGYCLNVYSNYGVSTRPEVTEFTPGEVVKGK